MNFGLVTAILVQIVSCSVEHMNDFPQTVVERRLNSKEEEFIETTERVQKINSQLEKLFSRIGSLQRKMDSGYDTTNMFLNDLTSELEKKVTTLEANMLGYSVNQIQPKTQKSSELSSEDRQSEQITKLEGKIKELIKENDEFYRTEKKTLKNDSNISRMLYDGSERVPSFVGVQSPNKLTDTIPSIPEKCESYEQNIMNEGFDLVSTGEVKAELPNIKTQTIQITAAENQKTVIDAFGIVPRELNHPAQI